MAPLPHDRRSSVPRVIGVGGPTAAGKSSFALRLARRVNGEVVSIDSVQQWRGFNIGSGKLTPAECGDVPHHLLDIIDPPVRSDVKSFCLAARAAIDDIIRRGKVPIVCGGTTMYVTALVDGIDEAASADPALRESLAELSQAALWEKLTELDREATLRIHPHDRIRIVRAIERVLSPITELPPFFPLRQDCDVIFLPLCVDRGELYAAIEARVDAMLGAGLVDEVRGLASSWGWQLPGFSAVGYAQVVRYLKSELSQEQLRDEIVQATRRLAKRQMTYWRNEPVKRGWEISPPQDTDPSEASERRVLHSVVERGAESGGRGGRPSEQRRGFRSFCADPETVAEELSATAEGPPGVRVWYLALG